MYTYSMRRTVVVTIGLILLLSTARFSLAQETTPQEPPTDLPATQREPEVEPTTAPADPIQFMNTLEKNDQAEYLNRRYLELLEQYRTQEQAYTVARNQYLKLNTLASQELAVKETRTLLVTRADIYLVYLQRLKMTLEETKGIPIENKSPQLIRLTLLGEVVQLHRSSIASALDRNSVEEESRSFEAQIKEIEKEAHRTQALIRMGRIQTAFDKLKVLRDAVNADVMAREMSAAKKAEKERGFNQIDENINTVQNDMGRSLNDVFSRQSITTLSQLNQLSSALQGPYGRMYKTVEFLQEVRK